MPLIRGALFASLLGYEGAVGVLPDAPAYDGNYNGLALLGPHWFQGGFRTHYLPWVREVVGRYASHPAIFAWELGNELQCAADPAAFIAFADEVGRTIRSLDANHLIASGMITAAWLDMAHARQLYGLPVLDVITLHEYEGSRQFDDAWLAAELNKPMIVEEAGFSSGNRAQLVDSDVSYWVGSRSARGYVQWGFTVIVPDDGNGDRLYGMDRLGHAGDYGALVSTYGAAAARVR